MRLCFITIWCALAVLQFTACITTAKTMSGDDAGDGGKTTQNTSTQADAGTPDSTASKQGTPTGEILSVIVNVKQQDGVTVWNIGSVSKKPGRFKRNFANATPDYLKAYFTDNAGNKLDSNYFEHPLKRRSESPGANSQPATTIVIATEGTAYLRANNNTAISALSIYGADNKLITSFLLNDYLK